MHCICSVIYKIPNPKLIFRLDSMVKFYIYTYIDFKQDNSKVELVVPVVVDLTRPNIGCTEVITRLSMLDYAAYRARKYGQMSKVSETFHVKLLNRIPSKFCAIAR